MSLVYQNTRDLFPLETSANFPLRQDEALGRVRALTPQMPELKLTEANVLISQYRHVEAERIFLELTDEAANAAAARAYALFLQAVGRSKDSGAYIQQARRLEPLDPQARWHGAIFHLEQGRSEEALAEIARGLNLEGYEQNLAGMKFSIALLNNDAQLALQILEQMPVLRPDEVNTARLWLNGEIDGAMALVRANIHNPDISTFRRATYAQFAVVMGYPQTALDFFSAFPQIAPFVWLPYFSEMRKLPDFKQYLKERGLPDYWRATGNWGDYCHPVNDDFECL
jgi:tetratricopeptide (TPR) repeat protein